MCRYSILGYVMLRYVTLRCITLYLNYLTLQHITSHDITYSRTLIYKKKKNKKHKKRKKHNFQPGAAQQVLSIQVGAPCMTHKLRPKCTQSVGTLPNRLTNHYTP